MLFFWPNILFFYSLKFHLLFFLPSPLFFNYSYNNLLYQMSESRIIQNSTINYTVIDITVSRFTCDALINAHDAYMTVELYNNYYICVILCCRCYCLLKH